MIFLPSFMWGLKSSMLCAARQSKMISCSLKKRSGTLLTAFSICSKKNIGKNCKPGMHCLHFQRNVKVSKGQELKQYVYSKQIALRGLLLTGAEWMLKQWPSILSSKSLQLFIRETNSGQDRGVKTAKKFGSEAGFSTSTYAPRILCRDCRIGKIWCWMRLSLLFVCFELGKSVYGKR